MSKLLAAINLLEPVLVTKYELICPHNQFCKCRAHKGSQQWSLLAVREYMSSVHQQDSIDTAGLAVDGS